MKFLMHPQTKRDVDHYLSVPSHGLLLSGSEHTGKGHLARFVAEKLLTGQSFEAGLTRYEGTDMGIDEVRQLIGNLKFKLPGEKLGRRVVVLEHLERLGHEAQNALLKLFEEPPENTFFVCTASEVGLVLPTVVSRLSTVRVRRLTQNQINCEFPNRTREECNKAYYLSDGAAALLSDILEADENILDDDIELAKKILRAPVYDRLVMVDELNKHANEKLESIISAVQRILRASIAHTKSLDASELKRRITQLEETMQSREALRAHVSAKIVLCNLFLAL